MSQFSSFSQWKMAPTTETSDQTFVRRDVVAWSAIQDNKKSCSFSFPQNKSCSSNNPSKKKIKWNKQLLQTTVSGFCVNSAFLSGHLSNVRKMFSGLCNDVKMTLLGIAWRQRGSGSNCVINSQISHRSYTRLFRTKICVN